MPLRWLGSAARSLSRPLPLSILLCLLALIPRLAFALEGEDIAVIRAPTPGLDVDVNWNAARELRRAPEGAPNFELLICSAPLHPYWLAALQGLFGESMLACRIAVAVISSLRYVLLFLVCLRLSRRPWAAAAATALLALLPALIHLDSILLKGATDLSLLALLLFVLTGPEPSNSGMRITRGLAVGVILSLSFLNQLNTVFYLPAFLVWVLSRTELGWKQRLALCLPALGVFALTFAAFRIHSQTRSVPHTGVNLLLGFNPNADIAYRTLPDTPALPYSHAFLARLAAEVASRRPLTPAEADAFFTRRALSFVRRNPARALGLAGRRALAAVNDYEIKGEDQLDWLRRRSRVLNLSPLRYGIVFVLGVFGLAALAWSRRSSWLVLFAALLAAVIGAISLTMVFSRLRAPTTLLFGVLASAGLVFVVDLLRAGLGSPLARPPGGLPRTRAGALATLLLLGLGATWLTARPILEEEKPGFEAQSEKSHEHSLEREELERELRSLAADGTGGELGLEQQERRVQLLAQLQRHSETFREAEAIVVRTPERAHANWLYLRYLMWLGRYGEARSLVAKLRGYSQEAFDAIGKETANRFEREAFLLFVLERPDLVPAGRSVGEPPEGRR